MFKFTRVLTFAIAFIAFCLLPVHAQLAAKRDIERGQNMLRMIKSDIKDKYYDPKFRGMDLDAHFAAANEKMKTASSNGQIMGIIAQTLLDLQDSHTRFIPPARVSRVEYGVQMKGIWNDAFVIAVKPGSDAEAKGLKVGDQILAIDKNPTERANLWLLKYSYYTVRPQGGMVLSIKRPDGTTADITVLAKVTQGKRVMDLTAGEDIWDLIRQEESEDLLHRHRYVKWGDAVFVWKVPSFDLSEEEVDRMMDRARDLPALILDLRGNGGGSVPMLNRLIGNMFDHDIKVADWIGRKKFDPQVAKTRGAKCYKGTVVVLIDSESASASEIFARVMQLEKRAVVIGDISSGKVMVSRYYSHQSGIDTVAFFGASITEADLIMSDGKSLENVGVTPNFVLVPTRTDLAEMKDPVLSKAAELLGFKLSPAEAGKQFPYEWAK